MAEEVETSANSPCKVFRQTEHPTHLSHQQHSPRLSLTDQEIYSRGIVREVMHKRTPPSTQTNTEQSDTTSTASPLISRSMPRPNHPSRQDCSFHPFRPPTGSTPQPARPKVTKPTLSPPHQHRYGPTTTQKQAAF